MNQANWSPLLVELLEVTYCCSSTSVLIPEQLNSSYSLGVSTTLASLTLMYLDVVSTASIAYIDMDRTNRFHRHFYIQCPNLVSTIRIKFCLELFVHCLRGISAK